MDQRVDNERRPDSAPVRDAKAGVGPAVKKQSWAETLRKRRGLALALVIVILN